MRMNMYGPVQYSTVQYSTVQYITTVIIDTNGHGHRSQVTVTVVKNVLIQAGADLYGPAPLYTYTLYTLHYTLYTIHLYTYTLIHYTLIYTYTYTLI